MSIPTTYPNFGLIDSRIGRHPPVVFPIFISSINPVRLSSLIMLEMAERVRYIYLAISTREIPSGVKQIKSRTIRLLKFFIFFKRQVLENAPNDPTVSSGDKRM
ncbi:MAG: hypothetical protein WAV05_02335 [Anaerolineales bacterium]